MAATIAAMTLTTLSCKNGAKEQPASNVEQADTTAANPTATAQPEQQPEAEVNKPGDRPTFQLVGNVKTCKWKNAEANGETFTYAFDEQGNWTKRTCHGATGRDPWTETRTIVYY